MTGNRKAIIMDEADYMNPDSVQPALRGFIERFGNNVSFLFTCNYPNRIIAPIHSRCAVFDFIIPLNEKPKIENVKSMTKLEFNLRLNHNHQPILSTRIESVLQSLVQK